MKECATAKESNAESQLIFLYILLSWVVITRKYPKNKINIILHYENDAYNYGHQMFWH